MTAHDPTALRDAAAQARVVVDGLRNLENLLAEAGEDSDLAVEIREATETLAGRLADAVLRAKREREQDAAERAVEHKRDAERDAR